MVTADALHCQRQVAQQVVEQGGDYALALKGNQGHLRDDVQLFRDDPAAPLAQDTQISKRHGRIETRIASVSADVAWLQETHHSTIMLPPPWSAPLRGGKMLLQRGK